MHYTAEKPEMLEVLLYLERRVAGRWTYTVDIANCLKNNYFIDLL